MSNFIVGTLTKYPNTSSDKAELLMQKIAAEHSIFIKLLDMQTHILQAEILQTVVKSDLANKICFEISAQSGTADELMSPYALVDDWSTHLKLLFKNLLNFTRQLLALSEVKQVLIVFSEGYDTAYETLNVNASTFELELSKLFQAEGRVPSLAIVSKNPGF